MNETTTERLSAFAASYIEAALWSTLDDEGTALQSEHDESDLADEARATILADCAAFEAKAADLLAEAYGLESAPQFGPERAGFCFWLNRNYHGSGFWDEDGLGELGERLSEATHAFGECDLYLGDDGRIYVSGGVQ